MPLAAAMICLIPWAASGAGAPPVRPPAIVPATEVRTAHYDLHVEGLDAQDVGAMLEELHAQLRKYFAAAPEGRLSVAVYSTRDRWAEALQADRQFVPPKAGGYYAPSTRKAYLWLQPSAYFTRQVILHEATHQFHWLVATGNLAPSADWYTEGLAEYFGMHNWDGKILQTGVIPAITLEDYPSAAMRNFVAAGSDLERMLPHADRPEAWALVHFLLNRHGEKFREMAAKLDQRQDAHEAWKQTFGSDASKLSGEYGQWIKEHTQPWQVVWVPWQQRGDAIVSDCEASALTVLKETPKTLAVEMEQLTPGGFAGLVFAYHATKDFHLLQVLPGRKVRVIRRQEDAWVPVSVKEYPSAQGGDVLSLEQDDKSTTLWANGAKIATIPSTGRVGLSVEGCRACFRVKEPSGL
jgi:hypothetical protein